MKIFKILTIISCLLIIIGLLLAWNKPATGYELDIYKSTPFITWLFIGLAMLIGAGVILHQVIISSCKSSSKWAFGILILIIARLALLWIPFIRSYLTWEGDNISHWGALIDIVSSGFVEEGNFYPIAHTLLGQIIQITGLPINMVANLSTGILSIFFIVFTYLLASVVLPRKNQQVFAVLLSGFIIAMEGCNVFLMPNGWSILILPLLFALFFKRHYLPAMVVPFVIVLVMYPFLHPLSSLMVVFSFIIMYLAVMFGSYLLKNTDASQEKGIFTNRYLIPVLIQFAILIPWILSFNQFTPNIRDVWEQITSGGPEVFAEIGDTLLKLNINGWDNVILFFKLYGVSTFLIIISLLGMVFLIITIKNNKNGNFIPLFAVGSLVLFFGLLYLFYLLGFPGMSSIGGQRMLSYVQIFTPIIGSYALVNIFNYRKAFAGLSITIIVSLLLCVSFLSVRALYFSPYTLRPNTQITESTFMGAKWYVQEKIPSNKAAYIMSPIYRYSDGILGKISSESRLDLRKYQNIQITDHFGYDDYNTLGEQYTEVLIMNITPKDRAIYDTVWAAVDRFDEGDFEKLDKDITVNKIYEDIGFSTYLIN